MHTKPHNVTNCIYKIVIAVYNAKSKAKVNI